MWDKFCKTKRRVCVSGIHWGKNIAVQTGDAYSWTSCGLIKYQKIHEFPYRSVVITKVALEKFLYFASITRLGLKKRFFIALYEIYFSHWRHICSLNLHVFGKVFSYPWHIFTCVLLKYTTCLQRVVSNYPVADKRKCRSYNDLIVSIPIPSWRRFRI